MKLENQVVSLELAKELKELGVKKESLFFWRKQYSYIQDFEKDVSYGEFGDYWIEFLPKPRYETSNVKSNWKDLQHLNETEYSAFTVAELGEMLPEKVEYKNELLGKEQVFRIEQSFYEVEVNGDVSDYFDREYQLKIGSKTFTDFNEANARAKMLIYLIKNKLITVK